MAPHPEPAQAAPTLSELRRLLDDDLARFRRELRERLHSDVFLIDQGARYVVRARGKSLRPFLVLASARLFGEPGELTYRAAAIVELLHTATLVHDDVLDGAEVRRGLPSFNRLWGGKYAILFGDYLLAHSLLTTLEVRNFELVDLLADTARRIVHGQLQEWVRARHHDLDADSYFSTIRDKTAALFRASAELGALTMDRSVAERAALGAFGERLGIAFQIRDDILDLSGQGRLLGKPAGQDLRERKFTLPLLLALQSAPDRERDRITRRLRGGKLKPADLADVIAFIRAHDGVARAQAVAERAAAEGLQALAGTGDPAARALLTDFVNSTLHRSK